MQRFGNGIKNYTSTTLNPNEEYESRGCYLKLGSKAFGSLGNETHK